MTVLVFPSQLEGEPLERHETASAQTVEAWLSASVQKFERRDSPPITVTINGSEIAPDDWALTTFRHEDTVRIYPQAKGSFLSSIFRPGPLAKLFGLGNPFSPKIPSQRMSDTRAGERLSLASPKGNQVALNSPVREISGQRWIYPDYLLPRHRYFKGPREQVVEMLLCVGVGEFDIPLSSVLIGDTPIISLGSDAEVNIFQPGADISGRPESAWWHECAEVGNTASGTAGLALTATFAVDPAPTASSYTFNGFTVTIPSGAGSFPTGWASGMIVRIVAPYSYTVTDGGAVRDTITGDITAIGLLAGDLIEIAGENAGLYTVSTATATDLTLNWRNGSPVTTLATGSRQMSIGPDGLRYRITAAGSSTITVERLTSSGATDAGWPGFPVLTTSLATLNLDGSSTEGDWVGPFLACPDGEVTNRIEWDILFPNGLIWQGMKGEIFTATVNAEIQYRDYATAGAWTSVSKTYSGTTLDQIGYTESQTLASYIRPEVRFRRIGVTNNREISDKAQVLGLRAKLNAPDIYAKFTTMTLTVKGGDRIAAQTESLVSAKVTRKLPLWNGSSWSAPTITRSIEPWIAYVAKSVGYTDSDIDLAELSRLGEIWDARGDYYDDAINDRTTVKDAINDALAAGFSELTVNRGLITPVRDEPRTVFEQAYSPQNMTTPLVRQFKSSDADDFDGVDVEYFDAVSRQWEVVECRLDGDLGQRVEKMRIAGVTNRTKAWRIGMRKRRAQRYRRWGYTFNTELDAMNSGYLSYVPLLDDVPGYGQSAILVGYAVSGGGAILESSEPIDWSAGGVHVAGLRRPDGTLSGPFTATRIDDYRLSIASLPDFTPSLDTSAEPPHIYFGPLVRWCYPALITEVSPSGQVGCSVSAINYDGRVYEDDDNSPP